MISAYFERNQGRFRKSSVYNLEELAEFSWEDFLEEEALESFYETYLDKVTENMTNLDTRETETKEEQEKNTEETTKRILVVDEKALEKMYSYVERNYGKTYLTEGEEKKINALVCRGIHSD